MEKELQNNGYVANTSDNLKTHFFFSVDMQDGYSDYYALLGKDIPTSFIDSWVNYGYGSAAEWRPATPKEREENDFTLLLGSEVAPELYGH